MPRWTRALGVLALLGCTAAAASPGAGAGDGPVLHFGAVSFYNPRVMYLKYQPLVDYLTVRTGRPWDLVVSDSYERTVEKLCSGDLAMAYLGPLTYIRAHAMCGALPVVRLHTGGSDTYRSMILVRQDSPFATLADLAGTTLALGAPLSTSSNLVPRKMLEDAGLRPGADIGCRYYAHHDRAARAVLLGEADACGIRDIVGKKFEQRGLRVLAVSPPIANFPFVIAPGMYEALRQEVVRALVVLPRAEPGVRREMASWDEELSSGFALTSDRDFDGVRRMAEEVFGPGFAAVPESGLSCAPLQE